MQKRLNIGVVTTNFSLLITHFSFFMRTFAPAFAQMVLWDGNFLLHISHFSFSEAIGVPSSIG